MRVLFEGRGVSLALAHSVEISCMRRRCVSVRQGTPACLSVGRCVRRTGWCVHPLKCTCLYFDAQAKKEKKVHLTGLAKIKHDESYLTTGKEFQKLHGHTAKHMDKKIAKEAGLHDMGWMGSKSYIDNKLKVRRGGEGGSGTELVRDCSRP